MLRVLEHGYDGARDYATPERAEKRAREVADMCEGMCNVHIVPVAKTDSNGLPWVRYTAIFSCFSIKQDAMTVARLGFPAFA